jgi:hypothetical protein
VHAQNAAESAIAQSLFDEARTLMNQARYAEACPKFEESQRIDGGAGTLLNLAVCYERQGRTASAWTKYVEASAAARRAGQAPRARMADERAAALVAHLPRLTILVNAEQEAGLAVQRDGAVVGSAQWGASIPIDPGSHVIEATAPGRRAWQTTVLLKEGKQVSIAIPRLELASAADVAKSPGRSTPSDRPASAESHPAVAEPGSGNVQRGIALAAGAIAVAGGVTGTVLAMSSKSAHDDAEQFCSGPACYDRLGVDLKAKAVRNGNAATVSFAIAGAALAGCGLLWFTASKSSPQVGVGPGNIQIAGTW